MTSQNDPTPDVSDSNDSTDSNDGSDYAQTGQHGPEMDDTQVEATEALRDDLPPAAPEGTTDQE
jgi:hypothetical protein